MFHKKTLPFKTQDRGTSLVKFNAQAVDFVVDEGSKVRVRVRALLLSFVVERTYYRNPCNPCAWFWLCKKTASGSGLLAFLRGRESS